MKTLESAIEKFASEAMSLNEMNFIRGGGKESPFDLIIPPKN